MNSSSRNRWHHRLAVGSVFFVQGLSFSSWGSRIPTIQEKLQLSEGALGGVLFALPTGLMLSLPATAWIIAKVGSRLSLMIAALLYALTLSFIGRAPATLELVGMLFVFGFLGNVVNISVNTQAVGVEKFYPKPVMASFHGLWSLAGFSGASLGSAMIGLGWSPASHFTLVTGIVWLLLLAVARWLLPDPPKAETDLPHFVRPDKAIMQLGLLAFASMICEGAMFDWSGVYFRKVLSVAPAQAALGYVAFMSAMACTRFLSDWFTHRFSARRVLQVSGLLTGGGLLLSVVQPNLLAAITGFFLVGAGVSSVVPLAYSAAGNSKRMASSAAISAVSSVGFVGFLLGPPVIGFIAQLTSLRISFAAVAILGFSITWIAGRARAFAPA